MLEALFVVLVICCLAGVVIAAAQRWLTMPEPFQWVKGLFIFLFVVVVCCAIFAILIGHHFVGPHPLKW